ncbi:pyridoxal phosphate-dependent decarboxylase family protein [Falsibacillus albus]|uniref:Aspartate aminotransferase family protein n=1 Tax=Falsibacillus albus TaxID=2478915 RepID=A0A3L7JUT9_9BACI|nr:aminotransferase class V-fold PLP-dependent enzyme [Falsibacillus albus]RLQ94533.1 aspartate aminotransferase family protein [Falsibacillus albus]
MRRDYFESDILKSIRSEKLDDTLSLAREFSLQYMNEIHDRNVYPQAEDIQNLDYFHEDLADQPEKTEAILEILNRYGSAGTVAQTGGRYFGFVNGGILPASLGAKWLGDTWDQNAALYVISPVASKLEVVCEKWTKDVLNLPAETGIGFVGGSSTATLCGLTAGRNYLLNNLGYDASKQGLFNAPEINVVVGEAAHSTVFKALSIIGLGGERVIRVPCDDQGRMKVDELPEIDHKTLIILQAGNVNTGAFDDFESICSLANEKKAWVHVDGAFGLWALASSKMEHATKGLQLADSWSTDGHKTLNAPYDNGLILCRHKDVLVEAMHMTGSYIIYSEHRDGMLFTPEMSRRARSIELWATFKSLGKRGVAELVDELHEKAKYFADIVSNEGLDVLNDVVFNQVLIHFRDDIKTEELIKRVQTSGVFWAGGASWLGKKVMRISVCSYKTSYEDIEISAKEIIRITKEIGS